MSSEVSVDVIPPCDLNCQELAAYDARLPRLGGSWGNVCEGHWRLFGPGRLGTGHGQRLILKGDS